MKSQDNDESDEFSDGCRKMFSGFNILDNQNTEDSILNDLDLTTFPKGNPKNSRISTKSNHPEDLSDSKTSTRTVQTISNIRNTKSGNV